MFETNYFFANSLTQYHQLCFIADYIHAHTEADEHGEPPDNDTILEALSLPDEYDAVIDEAYALYYERGGRKYYGD